MKPVTQKLIGRALLLGLAAAALFTWFYWVHEDLPVYVRAPTSLLLIPVAAVDGMCYALGIGGIYGKTVPIYFVNWLAWSFIIGVLLVVKARLSKKD